MNGKTRRTLPYFLGFFLALALASCGGRTTPLAALKADSSPISRPLAPSRPSDISLPQVCNCVLRFDHLSIEQGLSQSSVRVIFQDSRGFLWFGTEDGLNRYDGHTFKIYKPDPDAPTSISDRWITAIVEDQEGYLWIGTRQGGLNRYDPRLDKFTHYIQDDSNPSSLNDNYVNLLYLDKINNLWVGTPQGLDLFDKEQNTFKHYLTASSEPEKSKAVKVTVMYQDTSGRFWLGTAGNGLKLFDAQNGTFDSFQNNPDDPSTISHDTITAIVEDDRAMLWVGTMNGLNRFNPDTGRFARFMRSENASQIPMPDDSQKIFEPDTDKKQDFSISGNVVNALKIDSTGNLWIGTTNGLNRYQPGNRFIHYRNDPSFTKSLSNNYVISIYEDRGGVLWIGTYGGGVNIYNRQADLFAYYRHDPQDSNTLSDNLVFPIYVDSQGHAWIGTLGNGLNRFTWSANRNIHFQNDPKDPDSLGSNEVFSIYGDQDGLLWIGTSNGLDQFNPETGIFTHYRRDPMNWGSLSAVRVLKVYVDSKNEVWVGTPAGLDRFNRKSGTFIHYAYEEDNPTSLSGPGVYEIYEDRAGNLWVGTFDSGLNRLDRKTGTFTRYQHDAQNKMSINNDSILSVHQDGKGRLWIGTAGGGLNLYHPETDSFTYYMEKDGLPNGVVYGILEDDQGALWLSTNFGISRFDPETETFHNFDAGDGLQSNEFNSSAFAKGKDGELYFGGINGLTVFQPSSITDNPYLPQVALTSLTQGDMPIATDSSVETTHDVTLKWPQNSLEFEFAALSYNQPDKNQYAYMLAGFDTNWRFIGTKRDGGYTNLPGGEYTLLLKATNSDGVWNEEPVRIKITVIPPIWQTIWFQVILSIVAITAIVGGFRLRTKSIQDHNRELERLVKERTHALEKRGREMEALYQADEKILRNVSLNQVFQTLVDVAVDLLHADRSVVFAWDEKQTKVVPRVSYGYSPETLKVMEFAKGEGNVGSVLATGRPIIARELDPETMRPDVRAAIIAEGIKSFVHLPIVVDNRVVAVFNVAFTRSDIIGEDIVRLFSALADRASLSIANMELFEQTKDLAVMEERNRLARDLHDSAKQKAFAALAQLGTARGILIGQGDSVSIHLTEAENLVSDVIQELTFLVQEIYLSALQEKGLVPALREYIFEWENRNDASVTLATRNERRLSLELEQAIYRVTQEALANVARHSHARRVEVSLVYDSDSIQLSLSDDGCGFDTSAKSQGMGLRSIRDRISSIHGTAQIQSAPGRGTRILVQVPTKGWEGNGNGKQSS